MANISASGGTISYFVEGEGWRDLGSFTYAELVENPPPDPPIPPNDDKWSKYVVGRTVTLSASFEPSPEFYGILVGLQLQYSLRELHRNLSRYASWPYTN